MSELLPLPTKHRDVNNTSRLLTIDTVYHQVSGFQTQEYMNKRIHRWLKSNDPPVSKHIMVMGQWELLEYPEWIKNPSLIMIENREGLFPGKRVVTDSDLEKVKDSIIQVMYVGKNIEPKSQYPMLDILPTEVLKFTPHGGLLTYIRTLKPPVRCTVSFFPE